MGKSVVFMVPAMRFLLLPAILLPLCGIHAAAPVRYEKSATLESVPISGGPSFGTKFFFAQNNQAVYRVIPPGQKEANPAARWRYWSAGIGRKSIFPALGYASLEVKGLNAAGAAFGKSTVESPAHKEAALYWTLGGGSRRPFGFDPGYSGLDDLNAIGQGAGFSNSGSYEVVAWNANQPGSGTANVPIPAGHTSPQVCGLSARGNVLLYLRTPAGFGRVAVWNGAATSVIGPAPSQTFYPSNCAMNSFGDVALLVFTAGGPAILYYIPAASPAKWLTFTFPGPVDSNVYNLRISDAGLASFDTSIRGVNTVSIVSSVTRQQYSFTGYRSYLNHNGALLFGNGGRVNFWDAASWAGQPAAVPVSTSSDSGGMDIVGFNDDGYLLVLNALSTTRSLDVLKPIYQSPAQVSLRALGRVIRVSRGARTKLATVETFVQGDPLASRIRYIAHGKLPAGLRLLKNNAILVGTPKKTATVTLRISASYKSGPARKTSRAVRVRVVVRGS